MDAIAVLSPRSRQLSKLVVIADAAGVIVGVLLVIATLVRGRPADGAGYLVVPAVPLIAVGQILAIVILYGSLRPQPSRRGSRQTMKDMLRKLPPALRIALPTLAVSAWAVGLLSMAMTGLAGGPGTPRPGCPYPIENHGSVTCVSAQKYFSIGADVQRFATCAFLFFFCFHLIVILGNLRASSDPAKG